MANFDRTIDNRWRPDLASSQRRVREEEEDVPVIYSRELSIVPGHRIVFEAHDAQTAALIRRALELERLPHGSEIADFFSRWTWLDRMQGPQEKQAYLETHIAAVRRDPERNEHRLVFLMLVFEPLRRSVSKAFMNLHSGVTPAVVDVNWSNRAEARMIAQVERERLFDVTREAALEAIYRYPSEPPKSFFKWLRETIAHRALDALRAELSEYQATPRTAAEAEVIQAELAGFELDDEPDSRALGGMSTWRSKIKMRDVFNLVEHFFQYDAIAVACREAIGRLPRAQREVIDGLFFDEIDVRQLATQRNVAESTIYNHKAAATKRLHNDDRWFMALHRLGAVRDRVRAEEHAKRYPDGRRPDGRRSVLIDDRAA